MGLSVAFLPNLRRMVAFSASAVPGLSLCIAPGVRRTVSLSWSAPATMTSTRKFRVIVSLVSLPLFCGVLPMVRLTFFLAHKACMATSLHFLARMLSSLTGSLRARLCLRRCRWRSGSVMATTLVFGCSLSMMFHVKHLIPAPSRRSTLKQWR